MDSLGHLPDLQDVMTKERVALLQQEALTRLFHEQIETILHHPPCPEKAGIVREAIADLNTQASIGAISYAQREELLSLLQNDL